MMRTLEHIDYVTEHQLGCLCSLLDGDWHDREYIRKENGLKNLSRSIISERILKPLESMGVIEQEEKRPIGSETKRKRKFARIRKDIDERTLHLLIEYSANDLVLKYSKKKDSEKAKFYLKIRNESMKKLEELEKEEEERQRELKEDYWRERESYIPYSKSYHKLIATAKTIAGIFEKEFRQLDGIPSRPYQVKLEEILERLPSTAYRAACSAYPGLNHEALRECQRHEREKYYGIDPEMWERGESDPKL